LGVDGRLNVTLPVCIARAPSAGGDTLVIIVIALFLLDIRVAAGATRADQLVPQRTHLALGNDTPLTRPVSPPLDGRIVATPDVGGLHHRYDRIAA